VCTTRISGGRKAALLARAKARVGHGDELRQARAKVAGARGLHQVTDGRLLARYPRHAFNFAHKGQPGQGGFALGRGELGEVRRA